MPTFKIACSWEVCGEAEIDANSFEEAWETAEATIDEIPLPTDASYIGASFQIDRQISQALNGIEED